MLNSNTSCYDDLFLRQYNKKHLLAIPTRTAFLTIFPNILLTFLDLTIFSSMEDTLSSLKLTIQTIWSITSEIFPQLA